jgi:hypothetical protein
MFMAMEISELGTQWVLELKMARIWVCLIGLA